MFIRQAHEGDAQAIWEIARSRVVPRDTQEKSGLIDYPVPSLEKYLSRIKGATFYVAQEGEDAAGFVDYFTEREASEFFSSDSLVQHIAKLAEDRFCYVNTIVVREEFESKGIAKALYAHVFERAAREQRELWGAIVHKPVMNEKSVSLAKKNKRMLVEEFVHPCGLTFGLYKKDFS